MSFMLKARYPNSVPSQGSVHLDALRGAAAVIVLLSHSRALYFSSFVAPPGRTLQTHHPATADVRGHVPLATEAVVIFFVLSGYLVGGSVLRTIRFSRWSWRPYLIKRLTRLLVVLVPAILLGVTLDHLGMRCFGASSVYGVPLGQDIVVATNLIEHLSARVVIGNLLFLQGILVPEAGTNVSLWSLANEFWYYVAFPFVALAIFSKRHSAFRLGAAVAACLILVFIGMRVALLFPVWILGALVSVLPQNVGTRGTRALFLLAAGMLLTALLCIRLTHMDILPAEYVVGVGSSALLYALTLHKRPSGDGAYRHVAAFFSKISYSLYLFHLPLAVFLCGLLDTPWRPWVKTPRNLAVWAASDLLIVIFTYGLWLLFESRTDLVRIKLSKLAMESNAPLVKAGL
jgi:peptidoglycan/LPS O-acetylase OafA/YrhL